MSWADCDFAGSGQSDRPEHGDCIDMAGHLGPHEDSSGKTWWTPDQKDPANPKKEQR